MKFNAVFEIQFRGIGAGGGGSLAADERGQPKTEVHEFGGSTEKSLVSKNMKIAVTPISADPICPFPSSAGGAGGGGIGKAGATYIIAHHVILH